MTFEPGHKYYPPKESMPGIGKQKSKRARLLALAVQDQVAASALVQFHLYIAMGKCGVKLAEDEDGEIYATFDDKGTEPTQDERAKSVNWLSDRGWGLPAQSIQLEANLRQHQQSSLAHLEQAAGALSAAGIAQIRSVIAGALRAAVSPVPSPTVIDADSTERGEGLALGPGAPASTTELGAPASTGDK